MKIFCAYAIFIVLMTGCFKQPSLPRGSIFNVTSALNDSIWYGTGKVLRLRDAGQDIKSVKQFNLIVQTDIDYEGMGSGPNPNTNTGCLDPEYTRTQGLVIYNIPLKKGRFSIARLDKHSQLKNEYARLSYIGNAGGLINLYVYNGLKPGWIRITKFDKVSGIIEGCFAISFSQDKRYGLILQKSMPATARFTDGLFRIKVTDVLLR